MARPETEAVYKSSVGLDFVLPDGVKSDLIGKTENKEDLAYICLLSS